MPSALTSTERSRRFRAAMTSRQRTAYRTRHAVNRRVSLVRTLSPSGVCAVCGVRFRHADLVVDHIDGRTWSLYALSPHQRAARYWRDRAAGVRLRVMCNPCSGRDGGGRRYSAADRDRRASRNA